MASDPTDVADPAESARARDGIVMTIVEQLVATLRLLASFSADPHARVGKLLSARKREEKKRLEALGSGEAGLQRADADTHGKAILEVER